MSAYYGREQMLPILLEVDDGVRLQRALDREKGRIIRGMRRCAAGIWQMQEIFLRKK